MFPLTRFFLTSTAVFFGLVGLDKQRAVNACAAASTQELDALRAQAEQLRPAPGADRGGAAAGGQPSARD